MKLTRVTLATASSVLLVAALAGCARTGDDADTEHGAPAAGAGDRQFLGASGEVAAVSGRTAQVQSPVSGQVAVSWTSDTTFTQQVDASLDDVTTGSCVMVTSDDDADADAVTAVSVRVLDDCNRDGAPGGRPSGRPTDLPSDPPSDMPSDMPSDRPRGFGIVGEVSAVSADGFTLSAGEGDVAVSVTSDTSYTTTEKASADAVEVGACLSAQGDADDTGALTATSINVSPKVDGQCTGGAAS
jgi:hypothetical protein